MRERAVAQLDAGLASAVSIGFARLRSPAPVLVAREDGPPGWRAAARTFAQWHRSELFFAADPSEFAIREAERRGARLYLSGPAGDHRRKVDVRRPASSQSVDWLLTEALRLRVPLHLIPLCSSSQRCRCHPSCTERRRGFGRLGIRDPYTIHRDAHDRSGSVPEGPPVRVHFLGTRFCGSTLLGLRLESHPQVFTAGELDTLAHDFRRRFACSCRVPLDACGFWGPLAPSYLTSEEDRVVDIDALVMAAAHRSGSTVVVDSSKHLGWVSKLPAPHERRYVHIVRDGRAYLWSARQWDGTPAPEAAREWASTHAAILDFVADHDDRVMTVRYEDLATRTDDVLSNLLAWLGVEPAHVDIDAMLTLTSHQVRGNPMRFRRRSVAIDEAWKGQLGDTDLTAFDVIAGDLAHRLGYA